MTQNSLYGFRSEWGELIPPLHAGGSSERILLRTRVLENQIVRDTHIGQDEPMNWFPWEERAQAIVLVLPEDSWETILSPE